MNVKDILDLVYIWDKWSFDTDENTFVFFTLHDVWTGNSEDTEFQRFKAKTWVKATRELFEELAKKKPEAFKTFTSHLDTYVVEEKLEPVPEEFEHLFDND